MKHQIFLFLITISFNRTVLASGDPLLFFVFFLSIPLLPLIVVIVLSKAIDYIFRKELKKSSNAEIFFLFASVFILFFLLNGFLEVITKDNVLYEYFNFFSILIFSIFLGIFIVAANSILKLLKFKYAVIQILLFTLVLTLIANIYLYLNTMELARFHLKPENFQNEIPYEYKEKRSGYTVVSQKYADYSLEFKDAEDKILFTSISTYTTPPQPFDKDLTFKFQSPSLAKRHILNSKISLVKSVVFKSINCATQKIDSFKFILEKNHYPKDVINGSIVLISPYRVSYYKFVFNLPDKNCLVYKKR